MFTAEECDENAAYYISLSTAGGISVRRAMLMVKIAKHWKALAEDIRRLNRLVHEERAAV
jgi:hypothetical protein